MNDQLFPAVGSVVYKHETRSTRAQGQCMNPLHLTAPFSGPDSLEQHVPTGELVGRALKVQGFLEIKDTHRP